MRGISGAESKLGRKNQKDGMKLQKMKGFKVDYLQQGGGADDKGSLFQQQNLHRREESVKQEEIGPGNK